MTEYKATNVLSGPLRMRRDNGEFITFLPKKPVLLDDIEFMKDLRGKVHKGIEVEKLIRDEPIKKTRYVKRKYNRGK